MSADHTYPCASGCHRPAEGYLLCRWCAHELATALHAVPWLLAQLRINATRTARYTDRPGSSDPTAVHALPYDPGAAHARDALITALSTWARDLQDRRGESCHAETADELAAWLRARVHAVRIHPAAGELHADLVRVIRRSYSVIDRPHGQVYVGPCGARTEHGTCQHDLYARADPHGTARIDPRQSAVRCRCGAEWDAEKRREWLLSELRDTLATAREIASAMGMLAGRTISAKTIRTWANRGQIASHQPPGGGPARHPIGEVIDHATSGLRPGLTISS